MAKKEKIKVRVTVTVDLEVDQEDYKFLKEAIDEGDIQYVNETCEFDCEGKFKLEKL